MLRAPTSLCLTVFALASAAAFPARAAFISPLTVTLSAPGGVVGNPTPVTLVNGGVSPAVGITVGDGTAIGGFMLPNERIQFTAGHSIILSIAAGNVNGLGQLVTGFLGAGGLPALYSFTNLAVANSVMTGFTGSVTGLDSPGTLASIVTLAGPSTLNVRLDNLLLTQPTGGGQSDALAVLTINLQTAPIPEPASWVLMLAGAAGLLAWRRRALRRAW
jgi:hypothetical protein